MYDYRLEVSEGPRLTATRFWFAMCWEILISGTGFMILGRFFTGFALLVLRLLAAGLLLCATDPQIPLICSATGGLVFLGMTWLSPLFLYVFLRRKCPGDSSTVAAVGWRKVFFNFFFVSDVFF